MVKTISVRMGEEMYEQLVEDAEALALNPAVMARAYIKMGLDRRTDIMQVAEHGPGDPPIQLQAPARKSRRNKKK